MAKTDPDVILLHGRDDDPRHGLAQGAVDPGDLIEATGVTTDGAKMYKDVQRHSTAGEVVRMVALEDQLGGTGKGIDEAYEAGNYLTYRHVLPGDEIYGWLATANEVAAGDLLEADGNGALKAHDTGTAIAKAGEALNNTSGDKSRLKVTVI